MSSACALPFTAMVATHTHIICTHNVVLFSCRGGCLVSYIIHVYLSQTHTHTHTHTFLHPFLALLEFILEDLRERFDLASAWLFAEYSISEGYLRGNHDPQHYDVCLTGLLSGAKEKLEPRDRCGLIDLLFE